MDNLDFLKRILMSGSEYWLASSKEKDYRNGGYFNEAVWLICLPYNIQVDLRQTADSIKLVDVEKLYRADVQNIPISDDYPPFQYGQSMHYFHDGYPLEGVNVKQLLSKALAFGSSNIHDYKDLIEECRITNKTPE